jgi:hypothetical protein
MQRDVVGSEPRRKMPRFLPESTQVADRKTVAPEPRRFAQVPVSRALSVCGEVAERLKAAVC